MVELSFEVPDRLLGHIYIAIGAVLKRAQQSTTAEEEPELIDWGETEAFADELPSIPRRLVGLEVMDLAFLRARRHRHAYAFAGVGAAGGTVPTLLIGIDQVAIFAMDYPFTGNQRTDVAVNIEPHFLHILVKMTPTGGGWQLREVIPDVQVGGGMAII